MRMIACYLMALAVCSSHYAAAEETAWQYKAEFLRPFWEGDVVHGESMLFVTDPETGHAQANVLYPVVEIISVVSSSGEVTYEPGRDYMWAPGSRAITLPAGSRIPSFHPEKLRRPANSQKYRLTHRDGNGEILFGETLEYHAMQTTITYRHDGGWRPDVRNFDGSALPRTIAKLRGGENLAIVVLGDSISSGCNASSWGGGAPFQPAYPELLVEHLEAQTDSDVTLTNLSISGRDTAWGIEQIDEVVALKPDLVIVAFGMNDAASRSATDYQTNTQAIMAKARERLPHVEFILVASMLGNRDWTTLQHERFPEYRTALAELCMPGTALADLTTVWTGFLERKRDWDLTGNGVNHPNDFGHRVYAQVLAQLVLDD